MPIWVQDQMRLSLTHYLQYTFLCEAILAAIPSISNALRLYESSILATISSWDFMAFRHPEDEQPPKSHTSAKATFCSLAVNTYQTIAADQRSNRPTGISPTETALTANLRLARHTIIPRIDDPSHHRHKQKRPRAAKSPDARPKAKPRTRPRVAPRSNAANAADSCHSAVDSTTADISNPTRANMTSNANYDDDPDQPYTLLQN